MLLHFPHVCVRRSQGLESACLSRSLKVLPCCLSTLHMSMCYEHAALLKARMVQSCCLFTPQFTLVCTCVYIYMYLSELIVDNAHLFKPCKMLSCSLFTLHARLHHHEYADVFKAWKVLSHSYKGVRVLERRVKGVVPAKCTCAACLPHTFACLCACACCRVSATVCTFVCFYVYSQN